MAIQLHTRAAPPASALFTAVMLMLGLASCGSGGGVGPGDGDAVATVTVSPDGLTLLVGGTGSLSADVRDTAGASISSTGVVWTSQSNAVATVSNSGTVTGVAVGLTQVIAAVGGKADTVGVEVIGALTLEVVPGSATVTVGGTAQFSVIARDATGLVVATPPVTWASANPSVGTVVAGLAVGVSVGTTSITASAGSVTSPPATLIVTETAAACDGVESVPAWEVSLSWDYAAGLTNGDNDKIGVLHSGDVTATLRPLGGVLPASSWEGSLSGNVSANDRRDILSFSPVIVETMVGNGAPAPVPGLSVFRLHVDEETCTYDFAVTPAIHATFTSTSPGVPVEEGDLPLDVIQDKDVLGAWRQLGLANLDGSFDAHFFLSGAVQAGDAAYIPFLFGQLLWVGRDQQAAEGAATVDYTILPKF